MKQSEFLLSLEELLELDPRTLNGSETLDSLEGWNSLAVIDFMALIDERCGIALQPRQITACSTVADLAGLLGDEMIK